MKKTISFCAKPKEERLVIYNEFKKLYEDGLTTNQIGKMLGYNRPQVRYGLNKVGIVFRHGCLRLDTPYEILERFAIKKVGCWEWSGGLNNKGYAQVCYLGESYMAHRFSYLIHFGEIGEFEVCHTCDNRSCTNPDHLFLGTRKDNMLDCAKKGRIGRSKINPEIVREIRRMKLEGARATEISDALSITKGCLWGVLLNTTWRHVQ